MRLLMLLLLALFNTVTLADPATPLTALARMPVKEVTVFKDGHAFVQHAGRMPVDAAGNVVLDALPQPVLGTFWPYSADKAAKLSSVTASVRKVTLDRTALTLRELIEANVGAQATITEMPLTTGGLDPARPISYSATIAKVLNQSGEELEATSPPDSGDKLPVKGAIVLLKTNAGTKAVALDRIVDVTFANDPATKVAQEEFRNLLTLHLDWAGKARGKDADVGMTYLQKGVRWIPNYKVKIDGKGNATVKLQATLINELTDLDDVTVNLVVGVPTFAFSHTQDPIALQQVAAQLSVYFAQPGQVGSNFDNGSVALSNSIMTQTARMGEVRTARPQGQPAQPPAVDLGPDVASQGKSEDLYIFQVKKVSLKKGQRMVLAVAEYPITYKDVYALDVPMSPPAEVLRNLNHSQQSEIARLLAAPKVMHKLRLFNRGEMPLTTAPALIVNASDRVIAQGMMHYTAVGAAFDLELTVAVDVQMRKSEEEAKRTPNAEVSNPKESFTRIDMAGRISLTNYGKAAAEIEVTRHVLGVLDAVDNDGKKQALNLIEDPATASDRRHPIWLNWYGWPSWWNRLNGIGQARWNVTIEPGKTVDLGYTWHYFWR